MEITFTLFDSISQDRIDEDVEDGMLPETLGLNIPACEILVHVPVSLMTDSAEAFPAGVSIRLAEMSL